mgnify:CR=1 FL=1
MNNEILTLKENENIIYEHDVSVIYLNDEYSFYLTNKNIIYRFEVKVDDYDEIYATQE